MNLTTTLSPELGHLISSLTGSGNTVMAISRLFSGGGENLAGTLPALVGSCRELGREYPDFLTFSSDLEKYEHPDQFEQQQICYEFNRLFVGPASPAAPPYESVYLSPDRLVMQEQTVAVRRMYQSENLMAASQGTIPDDFIATELEFAAYLLSRSGQAYSGGDAVQGDKYLSSYGLFKQEHLGCWLQLFAADVSRSASHPVFPLIMKTLLSIADLPLFDQQQQKGGPA
jgi:TorA maturation chaperone TorD